MKKLAPNEPIFIIDGVPVAMDSVPGCPFEVSERGVGPVSVRVF
jgi:hypothetical protein